MRKLRSILRHLPQRYVKNRDGATAIEFAVLALPFTALLFSIIELAVVFFLNSTMTHAMQEAARQVRTGESQSSCDTVAEFKAKICNGMAGLGNCTANLRLDVVSSTNGRFSPDLLKDTPTDPADPLNPAPQILPDEYSHTPPGAIVMIRAQYYHPLTVPGTFTRLANQPGNYRVLTATTAFRNEPFPAGCVP